MGKVLLTTGKLAITPYFFDKTGQNIYSVEELCYVLGENTFLLDADIISKDLVEWLDTQCGLQELAKDLYPFVHQKGTLGAFVMTILEYTGYYDSSKMTEVENELKTSAHLDLFEKKKTRIDYLLKTHKYSQALCEYDGLLRELPEHDEATLALVLHNKGVALAGLFLFDQAAEHFKEAYELTGDKEEQRSYLAAMRMFYNDKDYISFIAERPESYEMSLELERNVDDILTEWENSQQYMQFEELKELKQKGQASLYYSQIESVSQRLKNQYRAETAE